MQNNTNHPTDCDTAAARDPLEAPGADMAHFLSNAKRQTHTWVWPFGGMMHAIRDPGKGDAAIRRGMLDLWIGEAEAD